MQACPYCGYSPIMVVTRECPRCHSNLAGGEDAGEGDGGTRLESVEDLRRWIGQKETSQSGQTASPPPAAQREDGAAAYRPMHRPPIALLCILDDASRDGEWVRIRGMEFVVGRTEGDVVIPNDEALSGRHFMIHLARVGNQFAWRVKDLESSNGLFVRVSDALLRDGQEIVVGSRRFRFDTPKSQPAPTEPRRNVTQGWQTVSQTDAALLPSVVEVTPSGDGKRALLADAEHWLGSDNTKCSIVVQGDPFVSAQHAKFHRDEQGRWHVTDGKSRNGTWVRISRVTVKAIAEFQAGEQRFFVRIPGREH